MDIKNPLQNKKILLTSGPTWIPLDGVRILSNTATGELGRILATGLKEEGVAVTLLEGPVLCVPALDGIRVIKFTFFDELERLIKQELNKKYDCVIHLAAVSDYQFEKIFKSKVRSNLKTLTLTLVPTPKLIMLFKKLNPEAVLVGFKLETDERKLEGTARDLLKKANCDLVIGNLVKNEKYSGFIVDKGKDILGKANSRNDMSKRLISILKGKL